MEKEDLNLASLKSADGLVLPEKIPRDIKDLDLSSLKGVEGGLVLPEKIGRDGDLDLSSLSLDELKELSARIHQVIVDRKFEDLVQSQKKQDGGTKK